MKKVLVSLLIATSLGTSYALTPIDLDQKSFSCNGIGLNSSTAESTIAANCKNVKFKQKTQIVSGHNAGDLRGSNLISEDDPDPTVVDLQKLAFTTDDGTRILCYYKNNKLVKCKYRAPKTNSSGKQ